MKRCQKFGPSPPPLIWTKSKRTAVFPWETFPKLTLHTLPIYASFIVSNTCYLDFVHLHKIDLQFNFPQTLAFCTPDSTIYIPSSRHHSKGLKISDPDSNHNNTHILIQGGRIWQPFVRSKNGNENFRQARIYIFRVKCVVFTRNRKFAKLTQ